MKPYWMKTNIFHYKQPINKHAQPVCLIYIYIKGEYWEWFFILRPWINGPKKNIYTFLIFWIKLNSTYECRWWLQHVTYNGWYWPWSSLYNFLQTSSCFQARVSKPTTLVTFLILTSIIYQMTDCRQPK